jgi:ABC-type transport system involved in multi-copper enzyme maturation permease subunit
MDRRYAIGILGLPVSRTSYVLGKFIGTAGFVLLVTIILGAFACLAAWYVSSSLPPERPIVWTNVVLAVVFDAQKYILLIACSFLFSAVSTSFFLPIFGAISLFFVGSASQEAFEYIHASGEQSFSPLLNKAVTLLYYVLPNFSAFDLKVYAIYSVKPSLSGLALTFGYFAVYTAIVLTLSSVIFSKREIQ